MRARRGRRGGPTDRPTDRAEKKGGEEKKRREGGKNVAEREREQELVRPASNKLVIIFSQYLSWIGCYFIIFYCLLLLLLPARNPPLPRPQPTNPSPTNTIATTRHYHHAARSRPSRSVLLSRASHRAGGIHSRNSLLRSLFCCNHCYPPCLPPSSFPPTPPVSSPPPLPLLLAGNLENKSSLFFPFGLIDFDLSSIRSLLPFSGGKN